MPPWFDANQTTSAKADIASARVLAVLGDKVTTDHISPAGTIPVDSPAGKYLTGQGVDMIHFSTYGSRRGNHEVMVRGGFNNIRLRNKLAEGREGGWTKHFPDGEPMTIFDAAARYGAERVPLLVLAGKQYGSGSSRDWAAKAPKLLGVKAVIPDTFESNHSSNLIAQGVLPFQSQQGESIGSRGLDGTETFDIGGIESMKGPGEWVDVTARGATGSKSFKALCRIDNRTEMEYIRSGGVLPFVFSKLHTSAH